jgi:hypothetical protein
MLRNYIFRNRGPRLRDGVSKSWGVGQPVNPPKYRFATGLSHQRNKGFTQPGWGSPIPPCFFRNKASRPFRDKNWSWPPFETLKVPFFDALSNAAMPFIPTPAALDRSGDPSLATQRRLSSLGRFQTK